MSKIREDFAGVVHIYVNGDSVFLRAGDSVPDGVSVPNKVLVESGEAAKPEEKPKDETPKDEESKQPESNNDGLPDDGDSREAWNAYAESVGVNPAEYSKKEALIEALKAQ